MRPRPQFPTLAPGIARRTVLAGAAAAAAALTVSAASPALLAAPDRARGGTLARGGSFPEGVQAGVPRTNGATLWTRLAGATGTLQLIVSRNADLSAPVLVAEASADAARDGCVHVEFTGGRPGEQYFYRFDGADAASPVGRFRTLRPADSAEPARIGFFTCQAYTSGFYAAHRHLAAEDLDVVVGLGDYIYEGGGNGPGGRIDRIGFGEVDQYRRKYALYRSDENLRAMHAAHAFVPIWDDHEYRNNWWRNGFDGSLAANQAEFERQKANAKQAWFEHMPVPRFRNEADRIYRNLRLGRSAELFVLDERSYRDAQPCGDGGYEVCPDVDLPGRKFLGDAQKRWLLSGLRGSRASWKVLGNQDMLMGMLVGDNGTRAYLDTWDGYGAERTEVLTEISRRVRDVVVVTGDDHDTFAGELWDTGFGETGTARAGVEFVVPALSSFNSQSAAEEQNRLRRNAHLKLCDMFQHGYGVLALGESEARFSYRRVNRNDPAAGVATSYELRVPRGQSTLERL